MSIKLTTSEEPSPAEQRAVSTDVKTAMSQARPSRVEAEARRAAGASGLRAVASNRERARELRCEVKDEREQSSNVLLAGYKLNIICSMFEMIRQQRLEGINHMVGQRMHGWLRPVRVKCVTSVAGSRNDVKGTGAVWSQLVLGSDRYATRAGVLGARSRA